MYEFNLFFLLKHIKFTLSSFNLFFEVEYLRQNKVKKSVETKKNGDNHEKAYESMDELPEIDNLSASNSTDPEYVSHPTGVTGPDEKVEDNTEVSDDITETAKEEIENEKRTDFVSNLLSQQAMPYKSNPKYSAANNIIFGERLKRLNVLNSNCDEMLKNFVKAYGGNHNGSNNNDNYYYNKTENNSFMSNNAFMNTTIYRENKFDNMIKNEKVTSKQNEKGKIIQRA